MPLIIPVPGLVYSIQIMATATFFARMTPACCQTNQAHQNNINNEPIPIYYFHKIYFCKNRDYCQLKRQDAF